MPQHHKEKTSSAKMPPAVKHCVTQIADGKTYRLIICCELSTEQRATLSEHFTLVELSNDINQGLYDAAIIDCRGAVVEHPEYINKEQVMFTFALIDEQSIVNEPPNNFTPSGQLYRLELITATELKGPTLKLRLDARPKQVVKKLPNNLTIKHEASTNISTELRENGFSIFQHILQNSTDWLVVKDLEHRFVAATDRFLQSLGLSAKEVIGKNDLEIGTNKELVLGNPATNSKGFWEMDDEVVASGKPKYYHHLILEENSLIQLREHVVKIPLYNKQGVIYALLVCITQSETDKSNGSAGNNSIRYRSIKDSPLVFRLHEERKLAQDAEQKTLSAFKRKNNFIATASHDLRQPLHAIGLFIESLEGQIEDTEQRSTLHKMKQSSRDLNNLLNSILDISKLDADAVTADKSIFNIADLLKSIENEFDSEAKSKSITLTVNHVSALVYTDNLLLMRILRNLVSNAVKYTQTGSINIINIIKDKSLIIEVRDTGPGIPKAQYEAIFNEYLQLEECSDQPNFGMGLGLSIVKRLTDLLNLNIELESKLNEGTCLSLTIPLGKAKEHEPHSIERKKPQRLENHRIMLIEDNPVVLDAMHNMLSTLQCEAYPAANITEALEIINELEELPDLLLVDYQLANGITAEVAIKKVCAAAGRAIPTIIITGNTNSSLIRKANKSTYPVLTKPVSPEVLITHISSAIQEQNQIKPEREVD